MHPVLTIQTYAQQIEQLVWVAFEVLSWSNLTSKTWHIHTASLHSLPGRQLHDQRQWTGSPPLSSCCTTWWDTKDQVRSWVNFQMYIMSRKQQFMAMVLVNVVVLLTQCNGVHCLVRTQWHRVYPCWNEREHSHTQRGNTMTVFPCVCRFGGLIRLFQSIDNKATLINRQHSTAKIVTNDCQFALFHWNGSLNNRIEGGCVWLLCRDTHCCHFAFTHDGTNADNMYIHTWLVFIIQKYSLKDFHSFSFLCNCADLLNKSRCALLDKRLHLKERRSTT